MNRKRNVFACVRATFYASVWIIIDKIVRVGGGWKGKKKHPRTRRHAHIIYKSKSQPIYALKKSKFLSLFSESTWFFIDFHQKKNTMEQVWCSMESLYTEWIQINRRVENIIYTVHAVCMYALYTLYILTHNICTCNWFTLCADSFSFNTHSTNFSFS